MNLIKGTPPGKWLVDTKHPNDVHHFGPLLTIQTHLTTPGFESCGFSWLFQSIYRVPYPRASAASPRSPKTRVDRRPPARRGALVQLPRLASLGPAGTSGNRAGGERGTWTFSLFLLRWEIRNGADCLLMIRKVSMI